MTTTFQVTANVQATCAISATAAAFGPYTGVVADTTAILTVTCSNTTTYNIGLNAGVGTGATVTTRAMTGPSSALLNYSLFQDAAHSVNWGDKSRQGSLWSRVLTWIRSQPQSHSDAN